MVCHLWHKKREREKNKNQMILIGSQLGLCSLYYHKYLVVLVGELEHKGHVTTGVVIGCQTSCNPELEQPCQTSLDPQGSLESNIAS